jgi:hypothetical protein
MCLTFKWLLYLYNLEIADVALLNLQCSYVFEPHLSTEQLLFPYLTH